MCVCVFCGEQAIKSVYTSEFRPYVVFVRPPRLEELRFTRRRAKFTCPPEEGSGPARTFSVSRPLGGGSVVLSLPSTLSQGCKLGLSFGRDTSRDVTGIERLGGLSQAGSSPLVALGGIL